MPLVQTPALADRRVTITTQHGVRVSYADRRLTSSMQECDQGHTVRVQQR